MKSKSGTNPAKIWKRTLFGFCFWDFPYGSGILPPKSPPRKPAERLGSTELRWKADPELRKRRNRRAPSAELTRANASKPERGGGLGEDLRRGDHAPDPGLRELHPGAGGHHQAPRPSSGARERVWRVGQREKGRPRGFGVETWAGGVWLLGGGCGFVFLS